MRAENDLIRWCEFQEKSNSKLRDSIEGSLHILLNYYAYDRMENRKFCPSCRIRESSFDNWMYAQNELAEQIMHQVKIIPSDDSHLTPLPEN